MKLTPLASSTAIGLAAAFLASAALAQAEDETFTLDEIVVISAEEQIRQALGASTITSDDLARQPVTNDLSEAIRRMPGVNLTGTTASGQRGNNRQIDIRGMGPENTLILIDGKPVLSRNSVRMGRAGERDSRGDSNWVPPELVERIEVLRGPAAARYGSGAAGGVVNIITKRPETQTTSIGVHLTAPQDSAEGGTRRLNFMTAGPLGQALTYRLTGNLNKTDADDPSINDQAAIDDSGDPDVNTPAGREGVENRDLGALLTWDVSGGHEIDFEFGYSRQGNEFSGDTQNSSSSDLTEELANAGAETNVMRRRVLGVTHRGEYAFGESFSYLQWENSRNTRNLEGTAGSTEGAINTDEKGTIVLDNLNAKSEWILPFAVGGINQTLTLGAEFRKEDMEDGVSNRQGLADGVTIPGTDTDPEDRDPKTQQSTLSLYAESNIQWNDQLTITPSVRLDNASSFGTNFSPSLNVSYQITDQWTMKLGAARAFKTPNLFQLNPNYVYYTMGMGCPIDFPSVGGIGCYVVGNPDLEAETSFNKEIGFAYQGYTGLNGSLTYFHNDYKNRIAAGLTPIDFADTVNEAGRVLRWENTPEAVVAGVEGNIGFPIGEQFAFNANFTHMTQSENKQNGQPLSLIPDYTINASLDWYATNALTVTTSVTHYGEIEAATISATTGDATSTTDPRESYSLVNLGLVYDYSERVRISGGVTNLFDKQLFRTGLGANTFNEPGRAFYLSLNTTF